MAVITKKDEKIAAVVQILGENLSAETFILKFRELHPKDWDRVEKAYRDHERRTKPGKSHPMPKPDQFLRNALNVWLRAQGRT